MALSNRKYIQVPPDSTGKRVGSVATVYVEYAGLVTPFAEGNTVVGGTSATIGEVLAVETFTATTGLLHILLDITTLDGNYVSGENLLVNAVTKAQASADSYEVFWSTQVTVGANNPSHRQSVDEEGAAHIRFTEGSPQFSAFGDLKTTQLEVVQEYQFIHGFEGTISNRRMELKSGGTATASFSAPDSAMVLSCPADSGSWTKLRSNLYHRYQAGLGQVAEFSITSGDTGKDGVVRRWGYYDDDDGLFFEVSGSDLSVVVRSTAAGAGPVETKILQTAWNGDRLDGSEQKHNLSGQLLDLSKANLYWIDFQWLGVGDVRFGVFMDGRRITMHTVRNPNQNSRAYMRAGTLPITVEQVNEGTAASTSELRFGCAVVAVDGKYDPDHQYFSADFGSHFITSSTDWTTLFSGRAGQTVHGSSVNRTHGYMVSMETYTTGPTMFRVLRDAELIDSGSWVQPILAAGAEVENATPFVSGGTEVLTLIADGARDIDLEHVFHRRGEFFTRNATIEDEPTHYTIQARSVLATPVTASIAVNWEEIH